MNGSGAHQEALQAIFTVYLYVGYSREESCRRGLNSNLELIVADGSRKLNYPTFYENFHRQRDGLVAVGAGGRVRSLQSLGFVVKPVTFSGGRHKADKCFSGRLRCWIWNAENLFEVT